MRELCASFQAMYFSPQPNSFALLPMMAGTLTVRLGEILNTLRVRMKKLPLPLLTEEEQLEVIKSVWPEDDHPWIHSAKFRTLLNLYGSHPRSLQFLMEGYHQQMTEGIAFVNVNTTPISEMIADQFKLGQLGTHKEAILTLLDFYCFKKQVDPSKTVPGLNGLTYDDLAESGNFFSFLFFSFPFFLSFEMKEAAKKNSFYLYIYLS